MISQLIIPDTVNYMIAGYVVIALAVGLYIASLALRWRRAQRDYELYKNELDR